MKLLMCTEQRWIRYHDRWWGRDGLKLMATYEDGSEAELVRVLGTDAGWVSNNAAETWHWKGPFRTALQAVRAQRAWYMPFRRLCEEVRRERSRKAG